MKAVRALVFDVFGTLVDWRGSIARESQAVLAPRGVAIDWLAFADAWRGQYQPAMEEVRTGQIPFSKLDVLHRRNLEVVLREFKIRDLDESTKAHLNLAWHRLDAWPDVAPGLQRLRERYRLAPCSNGNISLMVEPRAPQRSAVGCDPRRRDRARLQAQGDRLPVGRGRVRLEPGRGADGRCALQ